LWGERGSRAGSTSFRKALGRQQIATLQATGVDASTGTVNLPTVLAHASGARIESDWPACRLAKAKTRGNEHWQAFVNWPTRVEGGVSDYALARYRPEREHGTRTIARSRARLLSRGKLCPFFGACYQ
jgi:hypothetical protein